MFPKANSYMTGRDLQRMTANSTAKVGFMSTEEVVNSYWSVLQELDVIYFLKWLMDLSSLFSSKNNLVDAFINEYTLVSGVDKQTASRREVGTKIQWKNTYHPWSFNGN